MNSNEYMRDYMKRKYHARRAAAIRFLGGKCRHCGTTDNLELDHIIRSLKTMDIAHMWSASIGRYWMEVLRCQLLCESCHARKTLAEVGRVSAKETHGTISSVRYCKPVCDACREVRNRINAANKRRRRILNRVRA